MKMHLANVIPESIVDGEGIRYVIFMQGCKNHCKGCHNPQTHSMDYNIGYHIEIDELQNQWRRNILLQGITISGGEPLLQIDACIEIANRAKEDNLDVYLYTGYTLESLLNEEMEISKIKILELLKNVDVLIDGKFEIEKRSLQLKFRGSLNQRLIDVQATINNNYQICILE